MDAAVPLHTKRGALAPLFLLHFITQKNSPRHRGGCAPAPLESPRAVWLVLTNGDYLTPKSESQAQLVAMLFAALDPALVAVWAGPCRPPISVLLAVLCFTCGAYKAQPKAPLALPREWRRNFGLAAFDNICCGSRRDGLISRTPFKYCGRCCIGRLKLLHVMRLFCCSRQWPSYSGRCCIVWLHTLDVMRLYGAAARCAGAFAASTVRA